MVESFFKWILVGGKISLDFYIKLEVSGPVEPRLIGRPGIRTHRTPGQLDFVFRALQALKP